MLVRLPLRTPFASAHGTETVREVTIVKLVAEDGVTGWGECSSLGAPGYATEIGSASWDALRGEIVPALLAGGSWRDPSRPMASAAVDTALADLDCRSRHASLAARLGGIRSSVESCAVIGLVPSLDELLAAASARVAEGYRHLKLKIRPGWDVEPLRAVRDRFPQVSLAADANGSYDDGEAAFPAAAIDSLGLVYLEQPFPADRLDLAAELGARAATPIALDESIGSVEAARRAVQTGAARVLNVKPARLGGIGAASEVCEAAAGLGVDAFVGGMLETGVGRAAALAVAGLPGCTLPTDLGPSSRYFVQDLTEPIEMCGGRIPVPDGEGIGVAPLPERLAAFTVDHAVLRR
jgi:O-succinylbenzoate synthase